jgi:SulP family sulfate permease
MTAAAVGQVAEQGTAGYAVAALTLAVLSGGILLTMGLLKLGFLANFLSHPVIAGFITASGILIAVSQFKHILGIEAHGHTLPEILLTLNQHMTEVNPITLTIGLGATGFLFWVRKGLKPFLIARGVKPKPADIAQKAGPVGAVVVTTLAVWLLRAHRTGAWTSWARCRNRCRRSPCRACRPTSSRQLFIPRS